MPVFLNAITALTFSATTDDAVSVRVNTDTQHRLAIRADGRITWGSGSSAGDVYLERTDTRAILTRGQHRFRNEAAAEDSVKFYTQGGVEASGVNHLGLFRVYVADEEDFANSSTAYGGRDLDAGSLIFDMNQDKLLVRGGGGDNGDTFWNVVEAAPWNFQNDSTLYWMNP